MKFILILINALLFLMPINGHSQLFKKLVDRTAEKIENRVEDKIVEGISNELANRAVRPLDNIYDQIFRDSYKAQNGTDWDDEQYENDQDRANAMQDIIANLYGSVDLPADYSFSKRVDIELKDYGEKKPNEMTMLFSDTDEIFGVIQEEDENKVMVFDFKNDIMTIYDLKEKSAMSIPNVMKMSKTLIGAAVDEEWKENMEDVTFEEHKVKSYLGCDSQGYKMKSDEEETEFYVCDDIGVSISESYGKMMSQVSPNYYKENVAYQKMNNGMLMYAKTKRKKDKKESTWKTQKVSEQAFILKNDEYKKNNALNGH